RAALSGVHDGQREAAQALGLSRWSIFAHVVFPQALRLALPGTNTMLVDMLKSTSLLITITAGELLSVGQSISSQTFEVMEVYLVLAAIYFAMCYPLSQALVWLERRVRAGAALSVVCRDLPRLRQSVGMVFQRFNLFPHLTAVENIVLAQVKAAGVAASEAVDTAVRLLRRVHLEHRGLAFPDQMSGGEQQRVAIAR